MPKLLSTANPKIQKGTARGYLSFILHLAPADESGYEVCPKRTAGCTSGCLNKAGHGGMFKKGETTNHVQKARIRRTKYFFENRNAFMLDLAHDITNAYKLARKHNLTPVIRLNGTSDLSWEKYIVPGFDRTLFEVFNYIQFYDYTKVLGRKVKHIPNYHLTFSRAEDNEADCDEARRQTTGNNQARTTVTRTEPCCFAHYILSLPMYCPRASLMETPQTYFTPPSSILTVLRVHIFFRSYPFSTA